MYKLGINIPIELRKTFSYIETFLGDLKEIEKGRSTERRFFGDEKGNIIMMWEKSWIHISKNFFGVYRNELNIEYKTMVECFNEVKPRFFDFDDVLLFESREEYLNGLYKDW